ncbi:DsbA family protein [Phenylobacterium sp.]|jgi:protein-disulfide isomerase|uniref:DsbA family protein n=1 Tax=Phenylobacterium sp. TaxID=1871053 RepID=UPI002F408941
MKTNLAAVAALAAALTACHNPAEPVADGKPSRAEAAFGRSVRAYLLEHPEVIEEAVAKLQDKKQAEAEAQAAAAQADARKLIPHYRAELERDPRDFVANPDGKVTVVEFFDYNCGYCKLAAPQVLKLIQENPDIRFVFKEFPIFGAASDSAAKVALTPAGKANGLALYQAWMAEKPLDEAGIDRQLAALGLNPSQVRKASDTPEIAKQVAEIRALAAKLKVQGTPAFIVGDTMIPGADIGALKAAITQAKAGELKQPAAG